MSITNVLYMEAVKLTPQQLKSMENVPSSCGVCRRDFTLCPNHPTWIVRGEFRCGIKEHQEWDLPNLCHVCLEYCNSNETKRAKCKTMSETVRRVMTIPGIVTQIATKLHEHDIGLKGLYTLFNDTRYRHELAPIVEVKRNDYWSKTIKWNIQKYIDAMHKVKHGRIRKDIQCGMYEYLCEFQDKLVLIQDTEPSFSGILRNKLIKQIAKYKGTPLGLKLEAYQDRLMPYFAKNKPGHGLFE